MDSNIKASLVISFRFNSDNENYDWNQIEFFDLWNATYVPINGDKINFREFFYVDDDLRQELQLEFLKEFQTYIFEVTDRIMTVWKGAQDDNEMIFHHFILCVNPLKVKNEFPFDAAFDDLENLEKLNN